MKKILIFLAVAILCASAPAVIPAYGSTTDCASIQKPKPPPRPKAPKKDPKAREPKKPKEPKKPGKPKPPPAPPWVK